MPEEAYDEAAVYREALSLRYEAGYTNKEATDIMGVSANQVGVLLHHALNKQRLYQS